MGKTYDLVNYLLFLEDKGFKFQDDVIAFVYFGKNLTNCPDNLVIVAIELTLKTQMKFDGSFYISLLELMREKGIQTKKQAYEYVEKIGISVK